MSSTRKSPFQFTKEQTDDFKKTLNEYFQQELEFDLSNLQADLLLDFLNEKIGPHYYNQGITDSIKTIKEKSDDLLFLIKEQ